MVTLMAKVIQNQKPQCDRRIVTHHAARFEEIFRDMINDSSENLMLRQPPLQKLLPWSFCVAMQLYPRLLDIARSGIASIYCGPNKTLAVVGS